MMNLFGRAKQQPKSDTPQVLKNMRDQLNVLEKRQQYIEKKMLEEVNRARKLVKSNNRKGAILCLKRKRMLDKQAQQIMGAIMTIETQLMTIEGHTTNLLAMQSMRMATNTLRDLNNGMDIDDIADTFDDIQDQMEIAQEIGDVIGQDIGMDYDTQDLESELDFIINEQIEQELMGLTPVPQQDILIDPVPKEASQVSTPLPSAEDQELAALAAELGM
eukprot:TRINITY_DN147_c0_g1_i3.p1 TRINITY_DN147_c0_g1~~TRINITY_DN147_c0_g1_i3.p1  ORF type:complete len:218 (-),score=57.63 TRINITY_DN147_c0_g1_i3:29-682(-)